MIAESSGGAHQVYDRIGAGYTSRRVADPRWRLRIDSALADARRIVDIGAGTGSYEPTGRFVVAGIAEMRRVARRQIVLTYEPELHARFWLCDYIPEIAAFERSRTPSVDRVATALDATEVHTLPVPFDMYDGVLIANWRRPHAYLDATVRACCSGLAQLDSRAVGSGIERLRADLADGSWYER